MSALRAFLQWMFDAPFHGLCALLKSPETSEDEKDSFYQNPHLGIFDLICVEHRGICVLGPVRKYELMEECNVYAMYYHRLQSKPILVRTEQVLEYVGDIRALVAVHQEELLQIAKMGRLDCPLMLVNVWYQLKSKGTHICPKSIAESKNILEYHFKAYEHALL